MAVVGTAVLQLLGDSSGLKRELKGAERHVIDFQKAVGGSSDKAAKQLAAVQASAGALRAVLGSLAGATGVVLVGRRFFELGAAVEETGSKFRTVLGPSVDEAQGFLDKFARTAGLTNREGQELVATTAAMVQGMGLGQQASGRFAQQVAVLAGDLASFNNIPIAETSRAIQAAITGERESLKRLGVVILETDVQKRALLDTGKSHIDLLTQEDKALASLALITERAGVAVGDLDRTKGSAANRARALTAQFRDMRDSLAVSLMPAMEAAITGLSGMARILAAIPQPVQVSIVALAGLTAVIGPLVAGFKSLQAVLIGLHATIGPGGWLVLGIGAIASAVGLWALHQRGLNEALNGTVQAAPSLGALERQLALAEAQMRRFSEAAKDAAAGGAETLAQNFNRQALEARNQVIALRSEIDKLKRAAMELPGITVDVPRVPAPGAPGADAGDAAPPPRPPRTVPDQMGMVLAAGLPGLDLPKIQEQLREFAGTAVASLSPLQQALQDTAQAGIDAFINFAVGAGGSFRDMVNGMLRDLARLAIKLAIFSGLKALFPGSGFVASLVGSIAGRASGGPVRSGTPYLVGERGPELMVPNSAGTIVPNHALAGAGSAGITLDFSRFPQATNPLAAARDHVWQQFLEQSLDHARRRGWQP